MGRSFFSSAILFGLLFTIHASAQTSTSLAACATISPTYPAPVLAPGWEAQLVVNGLNHPRSILFDGNGHLLVVQGGDSIINLEFSEKADSCISVAKMTHVVNSTDLNHGIALSNDGKTLYASSVEAVYSWPYDVDSRSASGTKKTIITGMTNDDHVTRTLLMSEKQPGILVVSRGSGANIDEGARDISNGRAQVKAFGLANIGNGDPPYNFTTSGRFLGWGLRNSVGIAEEPLTGGLYSVENSADDVTRYGTDVHENNPGEEMNFLGALSDPTSDQPENHGYPDCFAVWDTNIPNLGTLKVGDQFTMAPNSSFNDTTCATTKIPPVLTFQAHMAPLDIIFTPDGTEAYVSFHGSWDRTVPVGYKVSSVDFKNGSPVPASDSTTALTDIFTNKDNSKCPGACFRPVGLARDSKGRIFVSSDATGEIWVLVRANGQVLSRTEKPIVTNGPTSAGVSTSTETPKGLAAKKSSQLSILTASFLLSLIFSMLF